MYNQQQDFKEHGRSQQGGGHGSKGSGRKGRLDHNILAYYRETLRSLEESRATGNDGEEETDLLMTSVFDSLTREGRQLSQNQTGSRLAEGLVALADWPRLCQLLTAWSENWSAIIEDRFAHRVLQAVVKRYLTLSLAGDTDYATSREVWGQFSAHMRLHYPEYLEHTYACHVLRSYLLLIGGVLVRPAPVAAGQGDSGPGDLQQRPGAARHESYDPSCAVLVDPPLDLDGGGGVSLDAELDQLASRFLENKHVLSLIDSEVTGPFLQVLMLVLKLRSPKRFRKFYRHLTKESGLFDATCEVTACGQTYALPSLMCSSRAAFFLEQLVSLLSPKQLRRFTSAHVAGREAALASHQSANFVLQRVLDVTTDADFLTACCRSESGGGWLSAAMRQPGRQLVVVRLARRCRQLDCGQAQAALQAAVFSSVESDSAVESTSLFEAIAAIGSYGGGDGSGIGGGAEFASGVAGCMLLYELFHFPDTGRLCASLLALPAQRLALACRCPRANRPVEACLSSRSVPVATKLSLCDKLLNSIADLSCDKYGSRVSDALWSAAGPGDDRIRERVARRLAAGGAATFERLRRDRFGRFAFQRFAPELYARRPGDWKNLQARLDARSGSHMPQQQPQQQQQHVPSKPASEAVPDPPAVKRHKKSRSQHT